MSPVFRVSHSRSRLGRTYFADGVARMTRMTLDAMLAMKAQEAAR